MIEPGILLGGSACIAYARNHNVVCSYDARTVWIKRHNQSVLINAIFVDAVLHCTNDPALYRVFRKRFEKRFELKSDDHWHAEFLSWQSHHS